MSVMLSSHWYGNIAVDVTVLALRDEGMMVATHVAAQGRQ